MRRQVVDAHANVYSQDESRYPMVEEPLRPPAGTGSVDHLKQEMAANGIERVVAIQTSTAYRWDNRFLADTARDNAPWMVGVCTLDPGNPQSPAILSRLVQDSNIRGLRSLPAGKVRKHLDHPGVDALWTMAKQLGIVINVLIHLELADELAYMLRRHPDLTVVLDHCMYPRGSDGLRGEIIQRVLRLAENPNLYAKLTWLVDSSGREYPFEDTHPLVRAVIDAFGPERCVWGSDFPCELWTPKATYTQHYTLFRQALGLSDAERQAILIETPGKLWFGEG